MSEKRAWTRPSSHTSQHPDKSLPSSTGQSLYQGPRNARVTERHSAAFPQSVARLGEGSVLVQSTNPRWARMLGPGPPPDTPASLSGHCEASTSSLTLQMKKLCQGSNMACPRRSVCLARGRARTPSLPSGWSAPPTLTQPQSQQTASRTPGRLCPFQFHLGHSLCSARTEPQV